MATATLDANDEVLGPVSNGRNGVSYQVDVTATITVTLQASLEGGAYFTIGSGLTADTIGTHNIPGAAYRLIASGVGEGGSAGCALLAVL